MSAARARTAADAGRDPRETYTARVEWRTTSTLLGRLASFDEREAWSGFVERFRRPLVALIRRLGVAPLDVEDVVQETLLAFAIALQSGGYVRERGRLSKWLLGIARKKAMRERGRAARRRRVATVGDGRAPADRDSGAVGRWEAEWERALLDECLANVRREVAPPTYRAFELAVLHRRSTAEIAQELGIAETAVYNAKHRVVTRVRQLRRKFDESQ